MRRNVLDETRRKVGGTSVMQALRLAASEVLDVGVGETRCADSDVIGLQREESPWGKEPEGPEFGSRQSGSRPDTGRKGRMNLRALR